MRYFDAFQLKSTTTYLTAPMRKGNSLSGPILKGTYKLSGAKLTFLTGTYAQIHWYGVWKLHTPGTHDDPRHIGMYTATRHAGAPKGENVLECFPWPR
jgi:hypothetical protein